MVIAIITDFGREIYPGVMKSVIRQIDPEARIIDVAHELPPQDVRTAAYVTRSSHRRLPRGSVILSVVDPGVGSDRRVLVAKAEADKYLYYFVAPDNGLLSVIHQYVTELLRGKIEYFALSQEATRGPSVSRTFHGRDVFAPLAAKIHKALREKSFLEVVEELSLEPIEPRIESRNLKLASLGKLSVAYVDRFGDVILNSLRRDPVSGIDEREKLVKYEKLLVKSANGTFIVSTSRYYDTKKRIIAIVGSGGLLEIARPYGSAVSLIGEVPEVEIEPI